MIKSFTALALAIATAFAPVAAQAKGTFQDHINLAEAVKANGVALYINPPACFAEGAPMGWYSGRNRTLVVCQDNAVNETQVTWTANDLDTLRHEAQHMIQDCMVGSNHDHQLGSVYKDPVGFALSILGQQRAQEIVNLYLSNGANDHVLVLELEAFAVAELNNPLEQVQDLKNYCGA